MKLFDDRVTLLLSRDEAADLYRQCLRSPEVDTPSTLALLHQLESVLGYAADRWAPVA